MIPSQCLVDGAGQRMDRVVLAMGAVREALPLVHYAHCIRGLSVTSGPDA